MTEDFTKLSRRIRQAHMAVPDIPQVACVGVVWNYHLLMGRRNDNGKWTCPGGHLEKQERPFDAAIRELYEEAGIKSGSLYHLGSDRISGKSGREVIVHTYRLDTYSRAPDSSQDPDGEIGKWEWVSFRTYPLPEQLRVENLHSPKNTVLKYLGLQHW